MSRSRLLIATALLAATLAAPASAFVLVTGGTLAAACSRQASNDADTAFAVQQCSNSLTSDALSPFDRAATHVNRGIIYINRGQYDEALRDFDTAIAMRPSLAEGYLNRGAVLLHQRDYQGAIATISRGLELDPENPARGYYNRGVAHEERGDLRQAYADYRRAAELDPAWSPPRTELARFRVT